MNRQFIIDQNGQKIAVVLPVEEYEELIEDLQDLAALADRRDDPTVTHQQVIERLKTDGYL